MKRQPRIVGIVNITVDSFSDGGRYLNPDDAIRHAGRLIDAGADVIELGPASSHPDSSPVAFEQEIARLEPVMDHLSALGVPISVDTYQAETQIWCAERRVAFINDIQGFVDESSYEALAAAECRLVVMHSVQGRGKATRVHSDPDTIVESVLAFFDARIAKLERGGIDRSRLVLDPGMGFFLGSNPEPSITMLAQLERLAERFELPVMISVSRKSFLGSLTGREVHDRGLATAVAELYGATHGADYIRTHDPAAFADALRVWTALTDGARGA